MRSPIRWKWKPLLAFIVALSLILFLLSKEYWTRKNNYTIETDINVHYEETQLNDLEKSFYKQWEEPNGKFDEHDVGENGQPVLMDPKDEYEKNKAYSEYGFNQFVSDKISLHRSLPDVRPHKCMLKEYSMDLPTVSVIIIFHNEGWSTLLRTVHSVLNRSPPELLHEIVLCDDYSDKEHLKDKLEEYIKEYPKIKLVRTKEREGLIRARVYGADHASGPVLLFLDSHCEANVGWLPPLLAEIHADYRTVVCPTVDFIDHNDFHYRGVDPYIRGTFNWRFDYKEKVISHRQKLERKDETEGVRSPVMAGGLFAISKTFWEEIGKYDPGMYVWGGEQYEISFKLWMCGGQMLNMPCSRVGHVYRRNVPYSYNKPFAVLINFKRVAEVWMDGFKEFLYHRRGDIKAVREGDITDRLKIRERNKCKSFRWYLLNVANDTVRTKYEPDRGSGQIRNMKLDLCLDTSRANSGQPISLAKCYGLSGQEFRWTYINEFRQEPEECLDARYTDKHNVYREKCHELGGNQKFTYRKDTKQVFHSGSSSCVSVSQLRSPPTPSIEECDPNKEEQKWDITVNDIDKPVPTWAQIAEDFPQHPIP